MVPSSTSFATDRDSYATRHHSMAHCANCISRTRCLPQHLNYRQLQRYENLIRPRVLHRGDRLFQQGDAFHSLYIVHSGSFKAYVLADDGTQQITGFHFQGELLGLDGLEPGKQVYSADALETSSICELPYDQLELLLVQVPSLRSEFMRSASRELAREKYRMLVLGKMHAEKKLAEFFLAIGRTLQGRGTSKDDFVLTMTRHDIANYLGLAVETVSRLLTRFQKTGLISIERRNVRIIDRDRLHSMLQNDNQPSSELRRSLNKELDRIA